MRPGAPAGAALLAGLWSAVAAAAAPGYNFLDLSYHSASPDEAAAAERSGFEVTLWGPLEPQHFLHLRYTRAKDDIDDGRTSALIAGLGFSSRWRVDSDWYIILAYEDHQVREADDTGYSGEGGLRWMLSDALEINGGGRYLLLDHAGEDVSWFGGVALRLGGGLAISGRYEIHDTETRYSIGLRLLPELSP